MSGHRWILAVDLGNGGPKVAVVELDGNVVGTAARPVRVDIKLDGTATQDADEWWTGIVAATREVVTATGADVAALHAVAITGQWGSTVPVGADDRPCGPVLLWADTRAGRHTADVIGGPITYQGFAPQRVLPWVRITGGAPTPSGADPTGHSLLLQREFASIYAKTRVLLEPVDYLGLRLTGRAAATPASMILSWLTDNRPGAPLGYVDSLVRQARRDPAKLPELLPTGSILGPLLPEVAEELGVTGGAPVVCGLPDLHAAIVGSGAVAPYDSHLALSTTAWIGARVPFKRTDVLHSIATVPGLDPQYPAIANNQETGAAALQWLREQVIAPPDGLSGGGSGIGAAGAAPETAQPSYEALIALAAGVPAGAEGVLFTPWLAGERSPVEAKSLRATWVNLSLRTDRSIMVRSVLEGVAHNTRWLLRAYERFLRRPVPSLRILGGGAESDLWCQIHADVLGRPVVQVADPRHAQLRGVALWARICLGEMRLPQVPTLVPVAAEFVPEPAAVATYAAAHQEYLRLYGTVRGMYRRLNG